MNQIQRAIALVTAPLGLIFLLSEANDLWNLIVATGLNWHRAFMPIAWGIMLGALAGIVGLHKVQKFVLPATWLSTALMTFGGVGTIAIYFEHRAWSLSLPTLWLFSFGLGVYCFFLLQARFAEKYGKSK
ncbi:hypothetical protein [Aliidiomarina celeris]|uniref:hypothetical protein n=1 Tax=Aliidiomarina celeris TaxID=2249428 RepID=UPI000DE8E040|nr:hypothetical protein [Aliidiomarina celeris]